VLLLSLAALLILRGYAAFFTVHIVTWDDSAYRAKALSLTREYNCAEAAKEAIFPKSNNIFGKITNYVNWLVVGLKIFPFLNPEAAFQIVNLGFFILQMLLIYQFSFLATKDIIFSMFISFLFMSLPIVFGISRWVLTENLVYPCLLSCLYFPLLLVTRYESPITKSRILQEVALTVITAYFLIISATAREYIIFTPLVISCAVLLILLLQKRWLASLLFLILPLYFFLHFENSLDLILSERTGKLANKYYYSPPLEWLNHLALHAIGPPFLLSFIGYAYIILKEIKSSESVIARIRRLIRRESLPELSVTLLMLAHFFLFAIYSYGIYVSYNRGMRPAMLPFFSLLGAAIIYLYQKPEVLIVIKKHSWFLFCLIGISWIVLCYQLFAAFEGGKTFAHHAYKMEHFNYPMHIRPLKGPNDMHTCGHEGIPCPFENK